MVIQQLSIVGGHMTVQASNTEDIHRLNYHIYDGYERAGLRDRSLEGHALIRLREPLFFNVAFMDKISYLLPLHSCAPDKRTCITNRKQEVLHKKNIPIPS